METVLLICSIERIAQVGKLGFHVFFRSLEIIYNIMFGINGKFGLSLNMLVGSVKAICTSIFWGLLKILNLNLIVLVINFIISFAVPFHFYKMGFIVLRRLLLLVLFPLFKPFRPYHIEMPANTGVM